MGGATVSHSPIRKEDKKSLWVNLVDIVLALPRAIAQLIRIIFD